MRKIIRYLKRKFYFFAAGYFSFWAGIFLRRWKPEIIVVTGSSGKTTLLHLFEAQMRERAIFSHKANSAFGIPFNILGLERKSYTVSEWLLFYILAPFKAFRTPSDNKYYVAEVDAERPGEASSLARLLKPDIVVWLSLEEAHGVNYDKVAKKTETEGNTINDEKNRTEVKKAIAHEYSYLLQYAKKLEVLNSDNEFIQKESGRTKAEIKWISQKDVLEFTIERSRVSINSTMGNFSVPALIPEAADLSVIAVVSALNGISEIDREFSKFYLPPGRSSVFPGKKNTVLIDSSYNATFEGMKTMLDLMKKYPASGEKWLVLGDMIEQGKSEEIEHKELAGMILDVNPTRVILVGPRLAKYTFPLLKKLNTVSYEMPHDALLYLEKELKGGETILFKGARFLEGVVEKLLADPNDAKKLCRREPIWVKKREEWGI